MIATQARYVGIDAARGVAVLLMVLDHVLIVTQGPDLSPGRLLTRASMPTFALLIGVFADKPLSWRRRWEWIAAGACAFVLYPLVGLTGPLLLSWLALGRWVARTAPGRPLAPVVGLVMLLTAWANGMLPSIAGEYHPAAMVALVCVGRWIGRERMAQLIGSPDRRFRWLAIVGRIPLAVYVGHLVVLALVVMLMQN